jgi:hypothetical protein
MLEELRDLNQNLVVWAKWLGIDFFIIFRKYFKCENNSRKFLENVLKHEKYSNNLKNPRKIPRDRFGHDQYK